MWQQIEFKLKAKARGFHLITTEVEQHLPMLVNINCGLLHLFVKHTSASLTINENADPTVRADMEAHFNQFVPENVRYYTHATSRCVISALSQELNIKAQLAGMAFPFNKLQR